MLKPYFYLCIRFFSTSIDIANPIEFFYKHSWIISTILIKIVNQI